MRSLYDFLSCRKCFAWTQENLGSCTLLMFFSDISMMNWFLLFPVSKLKSGNGIQTNFVYNKFSAVVSLSFLTLHVFEACFNAYLWLQNGAGIKKGFFIVRFIQSNILSYNLQYLAWNWPKFTQLWAEKEEIFLKFPYQNFKTKSNGLFLKVAAFCMILAFGDNLLYFIRKHNQSKLYIEACNLTMNHFELTYRRERLFYISVFGYQPWFIPIFELDATIGTMLWSLSKGLIIVLSIWLNIRLEQLWKRVKFSYKTKLKACWTELYEHYIQLLRLISDVDTAIGMITLQAAAHNFVFHCFYVFKVTR